ncbi:MAG: LysR family transcriptional regulator [Desulfovibrio sp.]|nr:LysR family transcriptional regulator [Desulfovibrio sp.]
MRLEQLRYLIAIIECSSFNKASKILHITQPALTSAIKALEEELGIPLLARNNKGVCPTAWGQKVYTDSVAFLEQFATMVAGWKLSVQSDGQEGTVRVLALPTICAYLAEFQLPVFYREHPHISVELDEVNFLHFSEKLRQGAANIGLTAVPDAGARDGLAPLVRMGYEALPLLADEYCFLLGAGHPLAQKPVLDREDVKALAFCSYTFGREHEKGPFRQIMRQLGQKHHLPAVCLNSRETIMTMLLSDRYATPLLEKMMLGHWAVVQKKVVIRKVAGETLLPCTHYLLHLPQNLLSAPENRFIAWLRGRYAAPFTTEGL